MNREQDVLDPRPNFLAADEATSIQELFERSAACRPGKVALTFGSRCMSYGELNLRANQLAHRLTALGVQPEVPVALYLERSFEMVIAILAVLKAGGAYVPIDLVYPKDRVSFMLEDTSAPVILTQRSLRNDLPASKATVLCLDESAGNAVGSGDSDRENPTITARGPNPAYIIYTSGSTGKPKGVIVTHRNVVRLFTSTQHWFKFNSEDVWPLFHSYSFDMSVWELWGSLFYGGRLVVVPHALTRSPADFYQLLAREGITFLNQTPSAFRQLIWADSSLPTPPDLKLRFVTCGGEALELQTLRPWFDRHGDEQPVIVNMYGITETTVHTTYRPIRRADLTSGVGSVIGVPIPDLQVHLLDADLRPVPAGTPGEICVGGAGVARGYLNRPELTSQRFIADPFSAAPGAKLYRSGDLAQINSRGEMEYLGRMDHQVKIRGFRVELGEIESCLNRHPQVRGSTVMARDDATGAKRLVAYIVPAGTQPGITALREHLAAALPDYMIPAAFVFMSAFPLTNNGKVDRRALPEPGQNRPELTTPFAQPTTELERTIVEIWQKVLGLGQIGIDDNFFELGGDSIRSISVIAEAQAKGLKLSLENIFQHPTVTGLAAAAEAAGPLTKTGPVQPFTLISPHDRDKLPADVVDAYPIARLQLGMFFHNDLDPASAIYHDVFSFQIRSRFEADKLRLAIDRLGQRHALLRTSFHVDGYSEPLELVHKQATIPFTVEDLRASAEAEQEQRLIEWVEKERRRAFDRTRPPLARFHAQIRSSEQFQLIFSFHHSCLDGWSIAAAVTELFQEYSALLANKTPAIAAPAIGYSDFIALERQSIQSAATRGFWAEKISGATPQKLPRWPGAPCEGGHEQRRGPELDIPAEVLANLKQIAYSAGVPLKSVLLAAHQHVMATVCGQKDILTGLVCNGRPEQTDGEKIIGLFLNTLPLRQMVDAGTWRDLVRDTFHAENELLPHRRFPISEVQKLNGGQPMFESAFDYVHFHVYESLSEFRDLDVAEGHYFEANNLTTYTTFMLDVSGTRLQLHIDYDPNVICREQVETLSHYYVQTLNAIAADPDGAYENFSPVAEQERQRTLLDWNDTAADYPKTARIEELFEACALTTPGITAVVFEGKECSYGELNTRANGIAKRLKSLGAGPGVRVAFCMERSVDMLAVILGILKSGATYIPLDPAYPTARLQLMLEDAHPAVIVSEQKLVPILPQTESRLLVIDAQLEPITQNGNTAAASHPATDSSNLAYIIFTSGSTGRPKGVQITHRSVLNLLSSVQRLTAFTEQDKMVAVTTLSFDIAGLEVFLPLISGGQVILAGRDETVDGTRLAKLINETGATFMQATPATWRLLMESGWQGQLGLKVFCGGEALTRKLADQLLERAGEVWNFYGPTETTIWSSAWKVLPGVPIVIGRPLANTQFYVLNERLQPVPTGSIGELYIGGDGVAAGYLNRPEQTKEKFIQNPFIKGGSSFIYRTGDLARYLPDGSVECLGRTDHQVKVRGFRIELGEIEDALRRHPAIAEALVTAREDGAGEKRLVAYFISRNGTPDLLELRDFLKARLPLYMVPGQFVPLQKFPLTPNGKINLSLLPAAEGNLIPRREAVPPTNAVEKSLLAIWQEVLPTAPAGIDDNFFDFGADSLTATRAFARMNTHFGASVNLRDIFDNPTVRALGEIIARAPVSGRARSSIPVQPRRPMPAAPQPAKTSL